MLVPSLAPAALLLAGSALAFPQMDPRLQGHRHHDIAARATFDADAQRIDVSGQHAFKPPRRGDLRGPCPGLNALANHNYLPRNGITSITQAIDAVTSVWGMSLDLGTFLSVYASVISGDPLGLSWSIGGAYSPGLLGLGGLLSRPVGLSGSHNQYEVDGSAARPDAGLNNGDASTLSIERLEHLYSLQPGETGGNYNYDIIKEHSGYTIAKSRAENPTFFWGPFSGLIASQAAHLFIGLAANHSAERPEGWLDQDVLKSFFGVTGTQGNLKSLGYGWERIPENLYRRPIDRPYAISEFATDNLDFITTWPMRAAVGGNFGVPGRFIGVDVSDLTGGVFNAGSLLQGNNAICFGYQAIVSLVPKILTNLVSDVTSVLGLLTSRLDPIMEQLQCPGAATFDQGLLSSIASGRSLL